MPGDCDRLSCYAAAFLLGCIHMTALVISVFANVESELCDKSCLVVQLLLTHPLRAKASHQTQGRNPSTFDVNVPLPTLLKLRRCRYFERHPPLWKRLTLGDPWFRSLRCTGLRSLVLLGLWHKTRWQSHLGLSGGILAPVRPRGTSAGKDVSINPRH